MLLRWRGCGRSRRRIGGGHGCWGCRGFATGTAARRVCAAPLLLPVSIRVCVCLPLSLLLSSLRPTPLPDSDERTARAIRSLRQPRCPSHDKGWFKRPTSCVPQSETLMFLCSTARFAHYAYCNGPYGPTSRRMRFLRNTRADRHGSSNAQRESRHIPATRCCMLSIFSRADRHVAGADRGTSGIMHAAFGAGIGAAPRSKTTITSYTRNAWRRMANALSSRSPPAAVVYSNHPLTLIEVVRVDFAQSICSGGTYRHESQSRM
jgi:hypothetical protein